jgi:hypothetical protein
MKKGGNKSLRTNSAFHSTFDITVGSAKQSLYVTIDGNYAFVLIELDGNIYALTLGWFGNYFLLSGFSSNDEQLTYSGDKLDSSLNSIVLTTNGGGAEKVEDNNIRQQLSNWKQFEYIKTAAAIEGVSLGLDAAANGCVIC